mgnify:CR=1 FL=1
MRKYAANLRERLIWQRMTRNTNTVKITAWGAVCIWNATSIAVGRFQKERIYDLEKFIKRYTHTAGDEANIYLKAPLKESAAETADNIRRSFNAQS